jgi:hypothetical protein
MKAKLPQAQAKEFDQRDRVQRVFDEEAFEEDAVVAHVDKGAREAEEHPQDAARSRAVARLRDPVARLRERRVAAAEDHRGGEEQERERCAEERRLDGDAQVAAVEAAQEERQRHGRGHRPQEEEPEAEAHGE